MLYLTAFSIGLLGSLHCVGMCGPIAFALPLDRSNKSAQWMGGLLYNIGRTVSYFLLGLVFGTIGFGFSLAGFQQWVSITVGVIIILSVLLPTFSKKLPINFSFYTLWLGKLKGELSKRFGKSTYQNLFAIGLLNGLLPCGLVYIAIAGSIAMQSPLNGGLFMAAFGLGTLPMMLGVAFYGNQLKQWFQPRFKNFIPVFIVVIGAMFILRGMNLGIPYLSPKISNETSITKCH